MHIHKYALLITIGSECQFTMDKNLEFVYTYTKTRQFSVPDSLAKHFSYGVCVTSKSNDKLKGQLNNKLENLLF